MFYIYLDLAKREWISRHHKTLKRTMFQVINAIEVAWHFSCLALFSMEILIDRELGQQLWMQKNNNKKNKQTPTHCQSSERKQDYLGGLSRNKQTIKKHFLKKLIIPCLATFQPSFAAKMQMVSHSVYVSSTTALQYVHGILIFPTHLFQASELVYICFSSAALEMHCTFFFFIDITCSSREINLHRLRVADNWNPIAVTVRGRGVSAQFDEKNDISSLEVTFLSEWFIWGVQCTQAFLFSFGFTSDWTKHQA